MRHAMPAIAPPTSPWRFLLPLAEMTGRASERVALEDTLRQALEEGGLPLDRPEVDQAFVRDLLGDQDDVAIVDHPGTRPLAQAPCGRLFQ
jgi:hypothetical protein